MGLVPGYHGRNGFRELGNITKRIFVDRSTYFFRKRCEYSWITSRIQFVFIDQEVNPIPELTGVIPENCLVLFSGSEQLSR